MRGEWLEWRNHILAELRRLGEEQAVLNTHIATLLEFKTETKASTRVTAVIISSLFGLASLAITVYVSVNGVK